MNYIFKDSVHEVMVIMSLNKCLHFSLGERFRLAFRCRWPELCSDSAHRSDQVDRHLVISRQLARDQEEGSSSPTLPDPTLIKALPLPLSLWAYDYPLKPRGTLVAWWVLEIVGFQGWRAPSSAAAERVPSPSVVGNSINSHAGPVLTTRRESNSGWRTTSVSPPLTLFLQGRWFWIAMNSLIFT